MYNFTDSSDNNHMVEFSVTLKICQKYHLIQIFFFLQHKIHMPKKTKFSHCFQNDIELILFNCFP